MAVPILIDIYYSTRNNRESALIPLALLLEDKDRIEDYDILANKLAICEYGLQCVFQVLIYLHDRRLISAPVTVVGCYTRC